MTTGVAPVTTDTAAFVARWECSAAAERANYQLFLSELCDLLGVPRPQPSRPDDRDNAYVFECNVHFDHGDGTHSTGRIAPRSRSGTIAPPGKYAQHIQITIAADPGGSFWKAPQATK